MNKEKRYKDHLRLKLKKLPMINNKKLKDFETLNDYTNYLLEEAKLTDIYACIMQYVVHHIYEEFRQSPEILSKDISEVNDIDAIVEILEGAVKIQKFLSEAEIKEYYIQGIYDKERPLAYTKLKEDISTPWMFLTKLLKYRYGNLIADDFIVGDDYFNSFISMYTESNYSSKKTYTDATKVRIAKDAIRRLLSRFDGNHSVHEVVDCYLRYTSTPTDFKDVLELKKSTLSLLLKVGKEGLIRHLLDTPTFIQNKPLEDLDHESLWKVETQITNAYQILVDDKEI